MTKKQHHSVYEKKDNDRTGDTLIHWRLWALKFVWCGVLLPPLRLAALGMLSCVWHSWCRDSQRRDRWGLTVFNQRMQTDTHSYASTTDVPHANSLQPLPHAHAHARAHTRGRVILSDTISKSTAVHESKMSPLCFVWEDGGWPDLGINERRDLFPSSRWNVNGGRVEDACSPSLWINLGETGTLLTLSQGHKLRKRKVSWDSFCFYKGWIKSSYVASLIFCWRRIQSSSAQLPATHLSCGVFKTELKINSGFWFNIHFQIIIL